MTALISFAFRQLPAECRDRGTTGVAAPARGAHSWIGTAVQRECRVPFHCDPFPSPDCGSGPLRVRPSLSRRAARNFGGFSVVSRHSDREINRRSSTCIAKPGSLAHRFFSPSRPAGTTTLNARQAVRPSVASLPPRRATALRPARLWVPSAGRSATTSISADPARRAADRTIHHGQAAGADRRGSHFHACPRPREGAGSGRAFERGVACSRKS